MFEVFLFISYFSVITLSILGYLNPLNWGKDISNTFLSELEKGLLYLLSSFLSSILSLFNSLMGVLMSILNGFISSLAYFTSFLGPFSLPIFFILVIFIFSLLLLAIQFVRNVPVVGDLA